MHDQLSAKYDILKVIGHGGFSAVFKARRKDDPLQVYALKQLDIEVNDKETKEYKDFRDEVEILKRLNHPNIVKVYAENILDKKPSIEMEFVDGETLESVLKRERYFSIDDTIDFILQLSSALGYCHHYKIPIDEIREDSESALLKRNAIIHNDVNPKNIIRSLNAAGDYHYTLVDFGLSFTDPDSVKNSKKEDGMAEYKAPEKWNATLVDTPSDIYSLGVVIYEMLTGSVPFPVADYNKTQDMLRLENDHKTLEVPDIYERRKALMEELEGEEIAKYNIPDWLQELVKKCLEKEPAKRFQTGWELETFCRDGLEGKIDVDEMKQLRTIHIDPAKQRLNVAYVEIVPNVLTEVQQFIIDKDWITIGRFNDVPGSFHADISIHTADKFISKNHCQLSRITANGTQTFFLRDLVPSKNGTYFNTDKNTHRIQPEDKIALKNGDYFWIGNTKIIFHQP